MADSLSEQGDQLRVRGAASCSILGRLAEIIAQPWVRALRQEELDCGPLRTVRGEDERCGQVVVADVDVCPGFDQELHDLHLATGRRDVQDRRTEDVDGVWVCAAGEGSPHRFDIAALDDKRECMVLALVPLELLAPSIV